MNIFKNKQKNKHIVQLKTNCHHLLSIEDNVFEIYCSVMHMIYIFLYTPLTVLKFNSAVRNITQLKTLFVNYRQLPMYPYP